MTLLFPSQSIISRRVSWTPEDLADLTRWWDKESGVTGTTPITSHVDTQASADLAHGTLGPDVDGGHHLYDDTDRLTQASSNAEYPYLHNDSGCTIAFNGQVNTGASRGTFLGTQDEGVDEIGIYMEIQSQVLTIGVGNGTAYAVQLTGSFTQDTFHTVIFTMGGGSASLYIDNTLADSDSVVSPSASATSTRNLTVGARGTLSGRYLDGYIDDIVFCDAVISAPDRTELHNFLEGRQ